jgi:hypothetical protein
MPHLVAEPHDYPNINVDRITFVPHLHTTHVETKMHVDP